MKTKLFTIPLLTSVIILSACSSNSDSDDSPVDKKIYEDAIETGNIELCKTISTPDYAAECAEVVESSKMADIAIQESDLKKCSQIKNKQIKESCEIQIKAEQNVSEKLEKEAAEAADIKEKALTAKDPDLCNQIPDENRKYACRYEILVNRAIQEKDPSLCDKIGNKEQTEICKQNSRTAD